MPEDIGAIETRPTNYSIPREQFILNGTNVTNPQEYRFPERVTRNNFTEFLRGCFSRSRGKPAALWIQFEWLKRKENFDYGQTFSNFLLAGGSRTLSAQELEGFKNDFFRISPHTRNDTYEFFVQQATKYFGLTKEEADDKWLRDSIEENLISQGSRAIPGENRSKFLNEFSDEVIDDCNTPAELFAAVDTYIRNKK